MSSPIRNWISKHKLSLALPLISIPFIYYVHKIRKKKRLDYVKMNSIIKPYILFQPNHSDNINKPLSLFLQNILNQNEVINNIEECFYQVITSNEIKDKLKDIGYKIIDYIVSDSNLIQELKNKLTEIAQSKIITKETTKFLQYIKQDMTLENKIYSFIGIVLNDEGVIELMNAMAKDSCYKAIGCQKVIESFDTFINEVISNEELIKYIYNKAVDIFSSGNNFDMADYDNNSTLKYKI